MSYVCVCAYAAWAYPAGAAGRPRKGGNCGWEAHRERPAGLGAAGGVPGFLPQRIPFEATAATTALLPAGSCWAVGPLCGEA